MPQMVKMFLIALRGCLPSLSLIQSPWIARGRFLFGFCQFKEDFLKRFADRPQFRQIPAGLHYGARQFGPHRVVFEAVDFEDFGAVAAVARNDAARRPPPVPDAAGLACRGAPATSIRTDSVARRRLCRFATESETTISPLLMMIDFAAGLLDFRKDVRAQNDGVVAAERLAISCRASRCCSGSRPEVGSSRISTGGL